MKRLLAIIIFMIATLIGCTTEDEQPNILDEPSGIVHSQTIAEPRSEMVAIVDKSYQLPNNLGSTRQLTHHDGVLYIAAVNFDENDDNTDIFTTNIYSQNIDGTNLTRLESYSPPVQRPRGANGGVYIKGLCVDDEGSLWIIEEADYYTGTLPDNFDYLTESSSNYLETIEHGNYIRKLDNTGVELRSFDMDSLVGLSENSYVRAITTDAHSNIYLNVSYWQSNKQDILVIGDRGSILFRRELEGLFDIRFITLPDCSIAYASQLLSENNIRYQTLQQINNETWALGETIKIPLPASNDFSNMSDIGLNVFAGSGTDGGFDVLLSDNNNVYGSTIGNTTSSPAEVAKLFSWSDIGIVDSDIVNITELSNNSYICINRSWDNTGAQTFDIYFINLLLPSELPEEQEKIELTVAMLINDGTLSIGGTTVHFNETNPHYRIRIVSYANMASAPDEIEAARNELSTDLLTGNTPDILYIRNLPYAEYAAGGWFADLYPFLDADPEYNRDDFIQGAILASEIDGSLYRVSPRFQLLTLIGHPSVVGPDMGWNMEEFLAVLDAHPEADKPLGSLMTNTTFLQNIVAVDIDKYIDIETGTVHFDTPDFIQLLELCNIFPNEQGENDTVEAIATGRQLMLYLDYLDVFGYLQSKMYFGGEITIKGFPSKDKIGNIITIPDGLAIMSNSPHKEAAWEFIRNFLSEDRQIQENGFWGLPSNKAAFDYIMQDAMTNEYIGQTEQNPFTQDDIDKFTDVINNASLKTGGYFDHSTMTRINDIIGESASDYFSGIITAEDAAKIIQDRISTFVAERTG